MQSIKTFLGWAFGAFFFLLAIGGIAGGSTISTLVWLVCALICFPTVNQYLLSRKIPQLIWWKAAILAIGLILLIGATAEPDVTSVSTEQSTPAPTAEVTPSPEASPFELEPSSPVEGIPPEPDRFTAQVVSVGDGDTIQVQKADDSLTIRLACIDAPESNQPQGQEASDRLRQLLPRETVIELRQVDVDRYGRTVAEVYQNRQSVNLQMVREGYAVVYQQYLDGCADTRDQYLQAEEMAKAEQLAFWSQSDPIDPWEWRQGTRPTPTPTPVVSPTPTPVASPSPTPQPAANTPVRSSRSGSCDCPYDTDRAGRACGGRSAYSRPGGSQPICYVGDR